MPRRRNAVKRRKPAVKKKAAKRKPIKGTGRKRTNWGKTIYTSASKNKKKIAAGVLLGLAGLTQWGNHTRPGYEYTNTEPWQIDF